MARIKNIVFDIGRVLIQVDHDNLLRFLAVHGAHIQSEDEFVSQTAMMDFERGRLSADDFLNKMAGLFPEPPARHQLQAAWVDIFSPIDEMLQLARELMADHRVYLLSNTNRLHWEHILARYALAEISHGQLTSCECGLLKPDAAIYRLAEQQFDLLPEATVFIDDLADNALAAADCGWQAIHHISVADTLDSLARLGVLG